MTLKTCKGLWFPFSELPERHAPNLMLASPKLVDMDLNREGVSTGYWQDDEGWIVYGWDSCNDEQVPITLQDEDITHFLLIEGPYNICKDEGCPHYGEINVCIHTAGGIHNGSE